MAYRRAGFYTLPTQSLYPRLSGYKAKLQEVMLRMAEEAMVTKELFHRWAQCDRSAMNKAWTLLWNAEWMRIWKLTRRHFSNVDEDRLKDAITEAMGRAMEDMDIRISGGRHLTKPAETKRGRRFGYGRITGRKLCLDVKRVEWESAEKFHAYYRQLWLWRCHEILRSDELIVNDETVATKLAQLSAPAGESLESVIFAKAEVINIIEALLEARHAILQSKKGTGGEEPQSAKIISAIILYIKREVVSLAHKKLSDGQIRSMSPKELIDRIDRLRSDTFWDIPFDYDDLWKVVRDELNFKTDDALYKARERFINDLATLDSTPSKLMRVVE